ncbi:MAG TPA: antibiotic biosynthesis monooxygenase [Kofleriaceae bacterium]|nr:antibiotic biosynthesis monooxygenase [Kofleriaceae bacterium]
MVKVGIVAMLEAKPGKEEELASLLRGAQALAEQEAGTVAWYALQFGPSTFGIFDAFADNAGRQAHMSGQIAAALMAKAPELLSEPPSIRNCDILAAK